MTKTELEYYVKDSFGMDLCEFVKHKVEVEAFHDYEIAPFLNVSKSFVRRLRTSCGIQKANGFSRRFERNYGKGAITEFKRMVEDSNKSLAAIGKYFNFSREYARQVYKKIYGRPYTHAYAKKRMEKARTRLTREKRQSKRMSNLMKVSEKMISMGFPAQISNIAGSYVILNNGYKLHLRISSSPLRIGRRRYFRINVAKTANADFDFFICICRRNKGDTHFVIPSDAMPKSSVTLLPHATADRSKYARFREGWHQLTN